MKTDAVRAQHDFSILQKPTYFGGSYLPWRMTGDGRGNRKPLRFCYGGNGKKMSKMPVIRYGIYEWLRIGMEMQHWAWGVVGGRQNLGFRLHTNCGGLHITRHIKHKRPYRGYSLKRASAQRHTYTHAPIFDVVIIALAWVTARVVLAVRVVLVAAQALRASTLINVVYEQGPEKQTTTAWPGLSDPLPNPPRPRQRGYFSRRYRVKLFTSELLCPKKTSRAPKHFEFSKTNPA